MSSFPGPWPLTLVAGGDSPSAVMDFSSIFSSLVSSTAGFSTTSCLFSGLAVLAGQQEGKERDVTRLIGSCPVVCWGPCHDAQSQGRWALPNSVPAQLCPILALSHPSSVPFQLCPRPALSHPGSILAQLCPIPTLSPPGSVWHSVEESSFSEAQSPSNPEEGSWRTLLSTQQRCGPLQST